MFVLKKLLCRMVYKLCSIRRDEKLDLFTPRNVYMGNSNKGYPRNGDRFWPAPVPTLGLMSIKTAVTGGTKVTGGTWNCPHI